MLFTKSLNIVIQVLINISVVILVVKIFYHCLQKNFLPLPNGKNMSLCPVADRDNVDQCWIMLDKIKKAPPKRGKYIVIFFTYRKE